MLRALHQLYTLYHRLLEDLQHAAEHGKGSELSIESRKCSSPSCTQHHHQFCLADIQKEV